MTQKSESLQIMFILTLIGGFLDSYSYVTRGGVFAFAQTGNLVLLSINICYGNLDKIARYIMPIIAFILGTTLVRIFEKKHKYMKIVHWRQVIIVFEGIILALVGFIPENLNKLACLLISFVCAMQIEDSTESIWWPQCAQEIWKKQPTDSSTTHTQKMTNYSKHHLPHMLQSWYSY